MVYCLMRISCIAERATLTSAQKGIRPHLMRITGQGAELLTENGDSRSVYCLIWEVSNAFDLWQKVQGIAFSSRNRAPMDHDAGWRQARGADLAA